MGDYVVNKITKKRYLKTSPKGKKLIAGRKARRKAEAKKSSRRRSRSPKRRSSRKSRSRSPRRKSSKKRSVSKKRPTLEQKVKKWETLYKNRTDCLDRDRWWNYKTNRCDRYAPSSRIEEAIRRRENRASNCTDAGRFWDDSGRGRCRAKSGTEKLRDKYAKQWLKDLGPASCRNTWWNSRTRICYDEGESPLDKLRVLLGTKESM